MSVWPGDIKLALKPLGDKLDAVVDRLDRIIELLEDVVINTN